MTPLSQRPSSGHTRCQLSLPGRRMGISRESAKPDFAKLRLSIRRFIERPQRPTVNYPTSTVGDQVIHNLLDDNKSSLLYVKFLDVRRKVPPFPPIHF